MPDDQGKRGYSEAGFRDIGSRWEDVSKEMEENHCKSFPYKIWTINKNCDNECKLECLANT